MFPLKALFALLLATLYLPATAHCLLEQAGWLPSIEVECCETSPKECPESDSASCGYQCCPLEYGAVSLPGLASTDALGAAPLADSFAVFPGTPGGAPLFAQPETSPPEIAAAWQFSLRAAPSPRAP